MSETANEPKKDRAQNVPRGLWRNSLGAELRVLGYAGDLTGIRTGFRTLGGDIAVAEAYDDLFKTTDHYLVTTNSLENCGYVLVEPEKVSER